MSGFISGRLDLFALSVLVAIFGLLGFVVFWGRDNYKSATARAFFYFSLATIFYGIANYAVYQMSSAIQALWAYRILLFSAVLNALSIFHFLYVFPASKPILAGWYKKVVFPFALFVSFLCLTPFVFVAVKNGLEKGVLVDPERGSGMILFVLAILFLVCGSLVLFAKKTFRAEQSDRKKFVYILAGTFLSLGLIIVFNFALPTFFGVLKFIPLAPVLFLPFAFFTTYAIVKYRVLGVDVLDARALITLFVILTLAEIFALILFFLRNPNP